MRPGFRQSMALLHSWSGLLAGWIVFAVFLFGATAFFQNEISLWMRPEIRHAAASPMALEAADRILRERAAGAASWSVALPIARGGEGVTLTWRAEGARRRDATTVVLDPGTGREIAVRETRGGFFLYRFHFDLHYLPVRWARYLVGVAAAAMLVALISGVVTHKKIFADFFLLRLGKGQRSWLDAHNVSGVLALPFFVMITYTGLVTLMFTLAPWAIAAHYPTEDAFYETLYPEPVLSGDRPEGSADAPIVPLRMLASQASNLWGGARPSYIGIDDPGGAAIATLYPTRDRWTDPGDSLVFDARTGRLIPTPAPSGPALKTQEIMVDLHRGWFAGPWLRWLYFLSGAGGSVMIATGLVLWTVKRRAKLADPMRPDFGYWLVDRLNIGMLVGSGTGIAGYFLANRLLPHALPGRGEQEINLLFAAWGAVLFWAAARPARRAWIECLSLCAGAYAAIPLVNAVTTNRSLLQSLSSRDWVFAGFDLTTLAVAALCATAAYKVAVHKSAAPRRRPTTGSGVGA